jgi:para-nitrobenzyl esterase
MNIRNYILACALAVPLLGATAATPNSADPVVASASTAIVETVSGKLQGFVRNEIYTFRGIQYATAERFMPPTPVVPWSGVRGAMNYGPVSLVELLTQTPGDDFFNPHHYWPMNDVCQYLNVWTPSTDPAKKRRLQQWFLCRAIHL